MDTTTGATTDQASPLTTEVRPCCGAGPVLQNIRELYVAYYAAATPIQVTSQEFFFAVGRLLEGVPPDQLRTPILNGVHNGRMDGRREDARTETEENT